MDFKFDTKQAQITMKAFKKLILNIHNACFLPHLDAWPD